MPWSRKGRAIPLLPLWAIRRVQSLSACTRMHFTFHTDYATGATVKGSNEIGFPLLHEVQTGLWCPSSLRAPAFFPGDEGARGIKLTTYLHLVPRLRMSGGIHLLPIYAFMVCTGKKFMSIMGLVNKIKDYKGRSF